MERSQTPIHTIVTGCAMSAGFMILISGHKRFAHKLSTPLYHQVSSGTAGTVKEMEEKLEESKRLQRQLEDIVKDKTDITKKRLREIFETKKDWYMTSEEALELNVVDEILK
jgi:ATP-dependent Clp protease protease subunit